MRTGSAGTDGYLSIQASGTLTGACNTTHSAGNCRTTLPLENCNFSIFTDNLNEPVSEAHSIPTGPSNSNINEVQNRVKEVLNKYSNGTLGIGRRK
ncbi:Bardet-Biedl syndrome 12 protein [Platysternon megacephalum]|uniref:Bardet-Biedl syndrome 12 protein n=1 Tax=Platysternon megacephalum TaxID=55544 RepID=A0A4D9DQ65_9SAUR|nr:Bardet-Biedl syndrome 12 protein [Platysternon megacephalum]